MKNKTIKLKSLKGRTININVNKHGSSEQPSDPQEPETVEVVFDYGDTHSILATVGETIELPEMERNGYTFLGWLNSSTGEIVNGRLTVTSSISLVAEWEAIRYSITYNMNGIGSVPDGAWTHYNIESQKYTPPSPDDVDGWEFKGWLPVDVPHGSTGNVLFAAQWKVVEPEPEPTPAYITIKYSVDGNLLNSFTHLEVGTPINSLPQVAKTGYRLDGWFDQPEGGNNVLGTIAQHDMTVYARWSPVPMTVTWHLNDNSLTPILKTTTVLYHNEVGELPNPTLDGKILIGWFTDQYEGEQINEHTLVIEDKTYYAHWQDIEWAITYDMNGHGNPPGMGQTSYTSCDTKTGEIIPPDPDPVEGWTFSGWTPSSIPMYSSGDVTFVANWIQNEPEEEEEEELNPMDDPEVIDEFRQIDDEFPIEPPTTTMEEDLAGFQDEMDDDIQDEDGSVDPVDPVDPVDLDEVFEEEENWDGTTYRTGASNEDEISYDRLFNELH